MLKPVTLTELKNAVAELGPLAGARFQEFVSTDQVLGLGFFHQGSLIWLVADLKPSCPFFCALAEWPKSLKGKTTPLQLFVRAHLLNRRLNELRLESSLGRVLIFDFGGRELELHLIPHATNALGRTEEKKISFHKPKELVPAPQVEEPNPRSWNVMGEDWLRSLQRPKKSGGASPEKQIEKKQKALETLREQLAAEEWKTWRAAGDWIKKNQSTEVPPEFGSYVEKTESLGGNLERIYKKAQTLEEKSQGTLQRIRILEEEIEKLKSQPTAFEEPAKKAPTLLQKSGGTGRRQPLREGVEVYVGRSAKDNLRLLRSANPWDYWLHLRDYPGAHGILHRHRGLEIKPQELERAAQLVAEESAGRHLSPGDRVDVLVTECRFVRPIKGDKHGRVTYKNERVLTIRFNA